MTESPSSSAKEVWITGIGIVSSLGEGLDAHWDALNQKRINTESQRFAPYIVHPLAPVSFDAQIPKKGDQRQMEAWQRIGTYAAGLALDVQNDGRLKRRSLGRIAIGGGLCGVAHPRGLRGVLHAINDLGYVGQHDGCAVAISDDDAAVVLAGDELVVGVDLVVLAISVEIPLGRIHARLRDRGAQIFQINSVRRKRGGIGLDAHGRLLAAADANQPNVADLGNLGSQPRIHQIFHLGQWNRARGDC